MHLWIGVACGLYILVVCVTGAALVFRIEMQRALHPGLFTTGPPGPVAHPAEIMESVQRAFPGDRVSAVDAPTSGRPTYLAYSSRGPSTALDAGSRFRTLLLDPVSGRLLGELNDTSFVRTLQDVHFDLLAGRTGRTVNGIGAMLLLTMCLTGLVIWWPRESSWWHSVQVDFGRSWRRVNWELHNAIGFWTVAVIAMWAVTGLYFAFPAAFGSVVNSVSPLTVARTPQSKAGQRGTARPWRTLIDAAREHAPPGHHVARVVAPLSDSVPFLVMFSHASPTPLGANLTAVYLDQYSGALLATPPAATSIGDIIMAWVVPLHVGNFAGTGVRVLWTLLGLAPALLFITGFTMWWTRVVRPRWRASRAVVKSRR